MKVLTVIGNRPQFVKAAAVSGRLREQHERCSSTRASTTTTSCRRSSSTSWRCRVRSTGWTSAAGSNTEQTARMLAALGPLLAAEAPDAVLVYGDTNSTLAGALAAAQAGIPVAHVEAGMRSFDRRMPEELNRVLTDHASDLLLCSSRARPTSARPRAWPARVEVVAT